MSQRPAYLVEAALMLLVIRVVAVGTTVGFVVGRDSSPSANPAPTGHSGAALPANDFGNPTQGASLFVSKGCADCQV